MSDKGMKNATVLLGSFMLAIGFVICGYFIQSGLVNFRASERHVEVKGLAERDVSADIAVWNITYNVSDSNLKAAQSGLKTTEGIVRSFLSAKGIAAENVQTDRLYVYQRRQEREKIGPVTNYDTVYEVSQTLQVRTEDVRAIEKAAQSVADLLERGVIIRDSRPQYLFTRLNDVKPDMIGEATRNAREAAAKFASDSGSDVGKILRAQQGWFNILPRDGSEYGEQDAIEKKVRVITTIDFMLEN